MSTNEFSRMIDRRAIGPGAISVEAAEKERQALARRFGLVAIKTFVAKVELTTEEGGVVSASGSFRAFIVQECAVSGEDLPVRIEEPLALRFVPARSVEPDEEEIELDEEELDEIEYTGTAFDLGEAVAQSLALAIDPYATGPEAERVRKEAGLSDPGAGGPFAALAALKKS